MPVPLPGKLVMALALLSACGGDPYARYATDVRNDVDVATREAFAMTARIQLTVVHNRIPSDSYAVVVQTVTRAARVVRQRATHFAGVTPPSDFAEAHAGLSADLSRVAEALETLGATFQQCAGGAACQGHLDSVSTQFQFVGEDLHNGREHIQRLLLRHGILLR